MSIDTSRRSRRQPPHTILFLNCLFNVNVNLHYLHYYLSQNAFFLPSCPGTHIFRFQPHNTVNWETSKRTASDRPEKTMPVVVDDIVAGITFANTIIAVASIINEAFLFKSECRKLRDGCNVIDFILKQNGDITTDDPAIPELTKAIKNCYKYLDECKTRRFHRNLVFEVTFHRRIKKYNEMCDRWVSKTLLSLQVVQCPTQLDRRPRTLAILA